MPRHYRDRRFRDAVPEPPAEVFPGRPLLEWLTAGDARFALVNTRSGEARVYKVQRRRRPWERGWTYYVRERCGPLAPGSRDPDAVELPDEPKGNIWLYLGELRVTDAAVMPTQGTTPDGFRRIPPFVWLLRKLAAGWDGEPMPDSPVRLQKSARCARCRHPLTDADSLAAGLGPDCRKQP